MHRGLSPLGRAAEPGSELRRGPRALPRRPPPRPGAPLVLPAAPARPPRPRAPLRSHRLLGVDVDLKGLLLESLQGDLHGAAAQLRCRACSRCWPLGGVCGLAWPWGRPRSSCARKEDGGGGDLSHSPSGAASPPAVASGRAAASATAAFPARSGRLASSAPAPECAESSRSASRQAENPLAHHRLVAAIIVTRREVPPPPPEKPGGWGRAGAARRRRLRRGCAQAHLRTPPRNWGGANAAAGCPRRTQAQCLCVVGFRAASQRPPPGRSPARRRSAYVQAPPGGSNCATRWRNRERNVETRLGGFQALQLGN